MSEYSIAYHGGKKPDSMDAALEMVKACPFLDIGTIEISEVMQMQ